MGTIKIVDQCVVTDEQRKALLHHADLTENGFHIGLPEVSDRQAVIDEYQVGKKMLIN